MSIRSLKRWWQIKTGRVDTPLDGEMPFWVASLMFHLVLIILLACLLVPPEDDPTVRLEISDTVVNPDELLTPELEFDDMVSENVGADGETGLEQALAEAPVVDMESQVELDMAMVDVSHLLADREFFEATGQKLSERTIKGSVGNSVSAASGATDRLTQEILASLEERPTLVVWLFDQSASLMRQREEILGRFDKIYDELGILRAAGHNAFTNEQEKPLLTQVVAFGSKVTPLLPQPTNDLPAIKSAVQAIERDDTGIENVMTAIIESSKEYAKLRKVKRSTGQPERNVMLIVVSDEAGDDVQRTDEAIQACNQSQMPVYVVGVPAPFGRTETMVKWVDPDPEFDQTPQLAAVSQGPESVQAERLRLDSTGTFDDLNMIDSGFGPFHLTRLCYETGGIYFAVHPNRRVGAMVSNYETNAYSAQLNYFFDPKVMRRYKPDYVSAATYSQRLQANAARRALVQAAAFTTTGNLESPRLRFPKTDEARFVTMVSNAQRSAAIIEPALRRLYDMLRAGEEDRPKELSPRWQAGFDLAIGRAIAAKARAESYNAMLALAKTKLKFDPPVGDEPQNNTWVLAPADTIETGSADAKLLAKGEMYLRRVVADHPDTPWAMLAQRELETPLGWEWKQAYTRPPGERMNNGNNNPRPEAMPKDNMMPKTKRPPPRL